MHSQIGSKTTQTVQGTGPRDVATQTLSSRGSGAQGCSCGGLRKTCALPVQRGLFFLLPEYVSPRSLHWPPCLFNPSSLSSVPAVRCWHRDCL